MARLVSTYGKKCMKKFYVYRKQVGKGCDYTIDCGVSFELFHGKSKEEVIKQIIDIPDDWKDSATDEDLLHDIISDSGLRYLNKDYLPLKEIILMEVTNEIDLFPFLEAKKSEIDNYVKRINQNKSEKAERAEYERLKKKFE